MEGEKNKADLVLHVSSRNIQVCVCVWWRFVVEHQGVLSGWKITWLAIPPTDRVIYGVEEV